MPLSALLRWIGRGQLPARPRQSRHSIRLRFDDLEARFAPAVFTVGPNDLIQAAIDKASSGDTIRVSGTHKEQIVIANEAGRTLDNLRIEGVGGKAVIQAPDVMIGSGAIVDIRGAQNVSISRFTIQGPSGSTNDLFGVYVHGGGSARIVDNRITAISDNPLNGVQHGIAIQVGGAVGDLSAGSATIDDNWIDKYQKGGIQVNGVGSSARIEDNRIQGIGPTAIIAQNGIVVTDGANAQIRQNSISGNSYTGSVVDATGIALVNPGKVTVAGNVVAKNDVGINVIGAAAGVVVRDNLVTLNPLGGIVLTNTTGALVAFNLVTRNGTDDNSFGGISLYGSTNNRLEGNISSANKGGGLFIDANSTDNTIVRNQFVGNTVADAIDESTGAGTSGTGNTWSKNLGRTSTPANLVSPGRFFRRFCFHR